MSDVLYFCSLLSARVTLSTVPACLETKAKAASDAVPAAASSDVKPAVSHLRAMGSEACSESVRHLPPLPHRTSKTSATLAHKHQLPRPRHLERRRSDWKCPEACGPRAWKARTCGAWNVLLWPRVVGRIRVLRAELEKG